MKMMILGTAALIVLGCAAATTESPADRAIAHWEGRPISEVIASWGAPSAERTEGDLRLYMYEASHYDEKYYPVNLYSGKRPRFPYGSEGLACRGLFEVNEQGVVTRAFWQGYECHFLP